MSDASLDIVAAVCAWVAVAALVGVAGYLWWLLREAPLGRRLSNLLYPASQLVVALFAIWARGAYGLSAGVVIVIAVCSLGCAAYDVVLFRRLRTAEQEELAACRTRALEEQEAAQRDRLGELEGDLDSADELRERMAGELEGLADALEAGDAGRVQEQLREARGAVTPARTRICAHPAVDALLAAKVVRCEGLGIPVSVKADVPARLSLPDVELCAILGNLIDNAVNAVERLMASEDAADADVRPFIEVSAGIAAGCFLAEVRNACCAADAREMAHGRGRHRRARGLDEHGWGVPIVAALVVRRGGTFEMTGEDGVVKASVLIAGAA